MNEDPLPPLRDVLLRRELDSDEERRVADWLSRHPELGSDWSADLALARRLRGLAPVPVPSNFTSLVMQQIHRLDASGSRPTPAGWLDRWRTRPLAIGFAASLLVALAALGWFHDRARQQHEADYAQQVSALRALAHLSPAVLEDFDAIQRFDSKPAAVDFELLAALQ